MLAACSQGDQEAIRDNQVMNESSYERHCCPTWVPREKNMEFAKVTCLFAKNGRSPRTEF